MNIGYARVSTDAQELGSQVQLLEGAGCDVIYQEIISGAKAERVELNKALLALKKGDTFTVWKLDRLGRSVLHVTGIIDDFRKRGISFKSITEQIDTKDAIGTFVFHMFAIMAEFERGLISERTKASLKFIKSQGRRLGPPVKDRTEDIKALGSVGELPVLAQIKELGWSKFKYYSVRKSAQGKRQ